MNTMKSFKQPIACKLEAGFPSTRRPTSSTTHAELRPVSQSTSLIFFLTPLLLDLLRLLPLKVFFVFWQGFGIGRFPTKLRLCFLQCFINGRLATRSDFRPLAEV